VTDYLSWTLYSVNAATCNVNLQNFLGKHQQNPRQGDQLIHKCRLIR